VGFRSRACEWSGNTVCSAIIARSPDYELEDVLVVEDPQQLRALADPFRGRIITLLRQRAASTTELAEALQTPKGTVGHHLKVLEKGELVRVVRTRRVRALTEKYYGRVARLFVLKTDDTLPDDLKRGALAAMMLRQASDELIAARVEKESSAILHVRLAPADVRRFEKRLNRLVADFQSSEDPDGEMHALAFALFAAPNVLPPRGDDA
jgi:DNA-binding transcriptional ArsR family regulator